MHSKNMALSLRRLEFTYIYPLGGKKSSNREAIESLFNVMLHTLI